MAGCAALRRVSLRRAEPQPAAPQAGAAGRAVAAAGAVAPEALEGLTGISGVLCWGDTELARECEIALSRRPGPILPVITGLPDVARVRGERHVCVDTTAAGGNAALLGGAA
mgnify:CR=1 FL=1